MNSSQVMGTTDRVVTVLATWFLGIAVQKKWLSEADSAAFLPIIIAIPAAVWGWWQNRREALIASTDALPGVAGVVTQNTPDGRELAKAVPSETVVTAGSAAAEKVAA